MVVLGCFFGGVIMLCQAEDGIRDRVRSRVLVDVYEGQVRRETQMKA
mgnify:CR=1 FL=1